MNSPLIHLTIQQSALFSTWPKEAMDKLAACADTATVEAKEVFIRPGQSATYLYLLAAGSMNYWRPVPQGRTLTVGLHMPGDFHGLGAIMSQTPHISTVVCREKTVLVRIPGQELRSMLTRDGRLSFSIFTALERRYARLQNLYVGAAANSISARIACLLNSIEEKTPSHRRSAGVNLSQSEIGTMLGTRRQVVNRVLRKMEAEGAILVQYGKISIVNHQKLREMAQDIYEE